MRYQLQYSLPLPEGISLAVWRVELQRFFQKRVDDETDELTGFDLKWDRASKLMTVILKNKRRTKE